MKLFWKIYILVLLSFVVVAVTIFYTISVMQISACESRILQQNEMLAGFMVKEIGPGLLEGRLPFDSLKELSDRKDFLFWWVVQDDGRIYLADKAPFMGTYADDYFPQIVNGIEAKEVFLNHEQEHGIYVQPFEIGKKRWAFWLGFSLKDISRMKKSIILANMVIFGGTLALLGTILFLIIKHFTKPIGDLALAAGAIGSGDLSHRAQIDSGDELGQLAVSFNSMAENLQKTTVSKVYVDNIIRTMKDPLIVVEPDRKMSTVNEATCELLGFEKIELIGKPIDVIFSAKEGLSDDAAALKKLLNDGELASHEAKWKTKSDEEIPILISGSVMVDDEGQPNCMVVTGKDISELKLVECELRKSQERFQVAAEIASDLIYECDMVTASVQWFGAIDQLLGYAPNEFPRTLKAWEEIVHPEDHDRVIASVECHIKTREPFAEEYRVRRKDGSLLYWADSGTALWDEKGRAYKWIGAVTDVTKRKQREDALRASEVRNRLLIEESPVGVSIVQHGKFAYVNPALTNILGCEHSDEIVGESPLKFVVSQDRKLIEEREADRAVGNGAAHYYDMRCLKKNGRLVDVSVWPREIEYSGKRATLSFVIDTSEAKSLRSQLIQAQKMEALGTLAGGIAHDFNNMLTIILGYSEMLLLDTAEDDPICGDLKRIVQTGQKGAELIRRLLTFSRQTEINPRPLNLNHEIEQFKGLLSLTIPKMIDIQLALSHDLATVNADPVQIDQILMNLAINAKDAMPDGGKLIIETGNVSLDEESCRGHLGRASGDYVLLTIADTGHGMDSQTLQRIFDPFFTTKGRDSRKGTGLGLAVVKGIVEQHGGHITCYSEPDLGTSFKIYFPAMARQVKPKKLTEKIGLARGTETVLLVDDEEFARDLGERALSKAGYTVVTASNGKEALERYASAHQGISLVILDLIMPEMDGKQCLEKLLMMDPKVKVLITSGYSARERCDEAVSAGAKGFVGKPFGLQDLLQQVRKVLGET